MSHPTVPFRDALRFWLKLGLLSFGGPAGQIALMHRELVDNKRWISEQRFLHALNYCMLLPGPEAQQLATYLGWLMHRTRGGIVAGVLFVLPSLLILIALSWLYMVFGQLPLVAGAFAGIKAAVLAIVLQAAWRIGSRALKHPLLWGIAAAALLALAVFALPFPAIVLLAGISGWLGAKRWPQVFNGGKGHAASSTQDDNQALINDHTPPPPHASYSHGKLLRLALAGTLLWTLPMLSAVALAGSQHTLPQMGWFFTKAALLTFGGAYAVLPYVYQGAVTHFGWLTPGQMMDGLALGETTPGPLIMVVAFVAFVGGYGAPMFGAGSAALSGIIAASWVTWYTFLPSFLFILAGAPLVEHTRGKLGFTAPLTAITAAVVGVIINLALFFGQHLLWPHGLTAGIDWFAALLAAASLWALVKGGRGVIPVIAGCAGIGLLRALLA
ncbi:chromate efflux transporter [Vogesella amnigena]|uniref:Chromate efflux transporter n=1 Tax=Vogesella amnigena TaxID=1507449 RepID=A0ABV7TR81_9NEIS